MAQHHRSSAWKLRLTLAATLLTALSIPAQQPSAPSGPPKPPQPWMDKTLTPDQRADLVLAQMTQDEKLQLAHGTGWGVLRAGDPVPARSNFGAGFTPGIDRLGIPDINLMDSAVGVRMAQFQSRYATLLPSTLGAAASWDPDGAFLYGSVIGREIRDWGSNMSIGGGVDLMREPRNGRNFEYAGEDPVLAGTMTGHLMQGVKAQQVMSDIKHFAVNDQETGRTINSAVISHKAMRESDLLAFQIAIGLADPSAVMCSYNKVNGYWACENDYLLNQVLKKDFNFKGFVVSDWEATHTTVKAVNAGLDMEMPGDGFLGEPLRKAIAAGQVPQARLDDIARRVLRSMFAAGVVDNPPIRRVVDPFKGLEDAQHIAEESIVLLRNEHNLLPLKPGLKSIVLIGSHADVGMLSGGGSAQVDAPGGNAIDNAYGPSKWQQPIFFPTSPLKYIRAHAPGTSVSFVDGTSPEAAASAARSADIAIVFANQPMSEGSDARTLSLPNNQDALIAAVAAANPRTIVVLETGGPVSMPWSNNVAAIFETWFPGIGGAQALANLIFGDVNPSAKLPATFARTEADLPHPTIPGIDRPEKDETTFEVPYPEGARFGYKWFDSENRQPLFPFGFGLSYTTYKYSNLKIDEPARTATFSIKNEGTRAGTEIAELYAALPASAGENFKRLVAFERVPLAPGETKAITLKIDPLYLSTFDDATNRFTLPTGEYTLTAGPSSRALPLKATMKIQ